MADGDRAAADVDDLGVEVGPLAQTTALASVIAYPELLFSAQAIYAANYRTIQLLIVASAWYLVATSVLYVAQYYIERHYSRGAASELPPTPLQRMRAGLFSLRRAPGSTTSTEGRT